jgi:hypothetical protein
VRVSVRGNPGGPRCVSVVSEAHDHGPQPVPWYLDRLNGRDRRSRSRWNRRMIMTPRFSPDQSQQINHLADGRSFGEGQVQWCGHGTYGRQPIAPRVRSVVQGHCRIRMLVVPSADLAISTPTLRKPAAGALRKLRSSIRPAMAFLMLCLAVSFPPASASARPGAAPGTAHVQNGTLTSTSMSSRVEMSFESCTSRPKLTSMTIDG